MGKNKFENLDKLKILPNTGGNGQKIYIETYGCQMNVVDSEVVAAIMTDNGFSISENLEDANIILVNTCSIRENAEQKVRQRLNDYKKYKKKDKGILIGVIGCMAERLKQKLLEEEKLVDMVIGPDAYRDLPKLVEEAGSGQQAINVLLSREETYADINPVRLGKNNVTAFVSIMRGCDQMCSYCVVPFTRGRERSRDPYTIIREVNDLIAKGYKEVTLLGQNVNSYIWENKENNRKISFASLLEMVAKTSPDLRVRYSTSHPKDMTDDVLHTMAKYDNICKNIHLPVQSGNNRVLENMRRGYTREWYMDRIRAIKKILPGCGLSSDFITGFCDETEEEHKDTLSLMKWAGFDFAFMFKYSERPNTYAERKLKDNIPDETKSRRLTKIIELQNKLSLESNKKDIGKTFEVLVEGVSRKSDERLFGRNSQNKVVVFDRGNIEIGDYVNVKITECTSATLKGIVV